MSKIETPGSFVVKPQTKMFSLLLIGILLIAANLRAPITSVGPVLHDVMAFFGLSTTAAGLINALPLLIFASAAPFAPWMIRRVGVERALGAALIFIIVGCLIRSFTNYAGLWFGTLSIGLGIAIANVLIVPLVKRDFPENTALCVGLYAATMAMAAALASGLSAPLASASALGWKLSISIWAILGTVALVVWIPQFKKAPEVQPVGERKHAPTNVWRSAIAWQVSMFMVLQTVVFYTIIDWYPTIAKVNGFSEHESGLHLFMYQAIAVIANLATSVALKKMRDQRVIGAVCSLTIVVGMAGLYFAPSLSMLWILFAGVGAGMSMVTCLTLFGLRTSDHHQAGALSGMAQCVGYGLGSVGPYLAGVIHEITGTWQAVLALLIACAALQTVFAYLAGRNQLVH
ncbi:MFS transporter [Pseudomonas sp. 18175]|uniref:MFS transporter n=1 Tax=Pseudomonas sp. 18175 TaxID=3390056 RepID=UPI003D1F911C